MSRGRTQGAEGTVFAGLEVETLESEALGATRQLWVRGADVDPSAPLLLFLDAEIYLERVRVRRVLRSLESAGRLPRCRSVFVSNHSPAARHVDYVCNPAYDRFVVDEVLPWIGRRWGSGPRATILIGLSLSGLAVAHLASVHPDHFAAVVSQSPSLWWRDEQFLERLPARLEAPPAFWISVGNRETEEEVDHPPTGLYQKASQIDASRRGAVALGASGCRTHFRLFDGGHDTTCWRGDLRLALPWAWRARRRSH